ncbi:hypothetical protein LPB136_01355 [Tenacibaculum todarodis]|uniref:Tetratricopeptide repeat protein n=1 Tax=Tenacibaculum todarodis TaxID=1850252 RepID=A0A1L3JG36_9FLAO|nr:tetratricopeptide repeat protein [Tenacibaculum todarodis]APG64097.1 hypothetical protein LPB136_01355 [Tenacibaculum todarodis]
MKKQILALTLGLMTVGAMAQKNELKAAEKAIKKNDFSGAITAISSAESLMSNMDAKLKAKFYFLKGKAFAGKKDYKNAADAFNSLLKHEEATGKAKYTKEAAPMLNKLISDVSQKAIKQYNESKDFKNASENFYLTYQLSPKDTAFAFNAAVAATQAKDYDSALKYYKELSDIGYTGIETQFVATNKETGVVENLGTKQQRDLMVKAGGYIKPETKSTKSKSADIVKNIALILNTQGKTDEAIVAMQAARKANPKDLNLLLNEADLYIKLKKMDKFGELMEEAIQMDPNNPTLFYNLGIVNFNQGKVEEAKNYYNKAIELKPDYKDAYMNLAIAILNKEQAIIEEMNKNLDNFTRYDELEKQKKEVYKEALPYLEKADGFKRSIETVRTLLNIYETLENEEKAAEFRALYKAMK